MRRDRARTVVGVAREEAGRAAVTAAAAAVGISQQPIACPYPSADGDTSFGVPSAKLGTLRPVHQCRGTHEDEVALRAFDEGRALRRTLRYRGHNAGMWVRQIYLREEDFLCDYLGTVEAVLPATWRMAAELQLQRTA